MESGMTGARKFHFGNLANGTLVEAVELLNGQGMRACVLSYGATLQSLTMPGHAGGDVELVLGYGALQHYVDQPYYLGATVGRFANRIAGGTFLLDGYRYTLAKNDGPNALHGGVRGFDKVVWTIERIAEQPAPAVTLRYVSPDGEEGYPGTLDVRVTYTLGLRGELAIAYHATCDRATVVNLTHHSLFNLGGAGSGRSARDAILTLDADFYLPVDARLIPLDDPRPVAGTPFDFRQPAHIATRLFEARDPQLAIAGGYDHTFLLNGGAADEPKFALRLEDPVSGRSMEVLTTEPGIQFYSGNFAEAGGSASRFRPGDGIAFEPQHFPDSPNRPDFPSTRLDPGSIYRQVSIFRFS